MIAATESKFNFLPYVYSQWSRLRHPLTDSDGIVGAGIDLRLHPHDGLRVP